MGSGCSGMAGERQPVCVKATRYSNVAQAASDGNVLKVIGSLASGDDVHEKDWYGRTALHLAACQGHARVAWILLKRGADPNACDNEEREPLQEAIFNGHKRVVDVLTKFSAKLSQKCCQKIESDLRLLVINDDVVELKRVVDSGHKVEDFMSIVNKVATFASEISATQTLQYLTEVCDLKGRKQSDNTSVCPVKPIRPDLLKYLKYTLIKSAPRPIMTATLQGKQAEPIKKPMVSVFFSDVVGFTPISSTLSPIKVTRMLNNLFLRLDRLTYVHGVQKIDVVGDAYIAATNFTEDQPEDHAARLARFALDAVETAKLIPIDEDEPDGAHLQIRVGLHCGPLEAYVTEPGAFKYTLLGETALVASKMESTGAPGRVHCTAPMAKMISSQSCDIALIPRPLSTGSTKSVTAAHSFARRCTAAHSDAPARPAAEEPAHEAQSLERSETFARLSLGRDGPIQRRVSHPRDCCEPCHCPECERRAHESQAAAQLFPATTASSSACSHSSTVASGAHPEPAHAPHERTFWVQNVRAGEGWSSQGEAGMSGLLASDDAGSGVKSKDFPKLKRRRSSLRLREAQLDQAAQVLLDLWASEANRCPSPAAHRDKNDKSPTHTSPAHSARDLPASCGGGGGGEAGAGAAGSKARGMVAPAADAEAPCACQTARPPRRARAMSCCHGVSVSPLVLPLVAETAAAAAAAADACGPAAAAGSMRAARVPRPGHTLGRRSGIQSELTLMH